MTALCPQSRESYSTLVHRNHRTVRGCGGKPLEVSSRVSTTHSGLSLILLTLEDANELWMAVRRWYYFQRTWNGTLGGGYVSKN